MNKKLSESEIQSLILIEVSKCGHRLWRSNAGSIKTDKGYYVKLMPEGFTDLIGHRGSDGKAVYIEVKKPGGKLREAQENFRDAMLKLPVIYGVARSAKEAIDIIENEGVYLK